MAVKGYPFGNARLLLWEYVPSGASVGISQGQQASLSAGATSGAYVCDDVKSSAIQQLADTELQIQGGDKIKATPIFPGGKLARFEVTVSSLDTVGNDLVGGGTTNNTNSQIHVTHYNPNRTSLKMLGVALQQGFMTDTGLKYALTRIIPRAQVGIRPGPMNFRGESDAILSISSIKTSKAYNGQPYGSAGMNLGLELDLTDYLDYITPNPFHIMAFRQDASATTFTCTYKPLSSTVTINASENHLTIGGTVTALSSINTSTGVATLAAAGSSGVYDVLAYATDYVPV